MKINFKARIQVKIQHKKRYDRLTPKILIFPNILNIKWSNKGEVATKVISRIFTRYLTFFSENKLDKKLTLDPIKISLWMLTPTQLVKNIENKTNNIMVKFVATDVVIKKLRPLKAMVINIIIEKPSLILFFRSAERNWNDNFKISLIDNFFFIHKY